MSPEEKANLETMRAQSMTRQGEVEAQEDEMYSAAAPKGSFSGKAANALVEATNRLLPLFGIKDMYDRFSEPKLSTLPVEFVRLLTMFGKAFDDAIEEGVLPEDAKLDLTVVTDDTGLQGLAGRIGMAAKSGTFKRFLSKKVSERGAEEMGKEGEYAESEAPESEKPESTDALFAGRM
jgi:hypothetical protein